MKVSAVIPAYNEEKRIGNVIQPLLDSGLIADVYVVDDGSKDQTPLIVQQYDVNLIQMPCNQGKAQAVKVGLQQCDSDIILLLDADLIGLLPKHIEDLINPVLNDDIHMTIGVFQSGRRVTDLAQKIAPYLSGQRAFKKELSADILGLQTNGYSLEVALSKMIKEKGLLTQKVTLKDISHVMKEEKLGLGKGMLHRMQMYKDIVKYWIN